MDFNNPGQAAGPEQVPKRDQAEYLMTTVLFYFGSIYHFFDKDRFLAKLEDFYDYDKRISRTDLWHIEFLLVMALGKLLLGRGVSDLGPPGTMEFLQAMKLLPNTANLYREQVVSTEILCCICMYLYCVDMRSAAHNFVSSQSP